ncbi:MAG TPA: TonB-dependent receptor [Chitinophagaceae bacterium]|nr:TonB-dependent receptor [Chitinophagaceae bacterium]
MKRFFTFLLMCCCCTSLFAQTKNGKITGVVTDDKHQPIESATVTLLRTKDKALVKAGITDKAGIFEFEKIAEGEYVLAITATGFTKISSQPFTISAEKSSVKLDALKLAPAPKSLGEVTVTGKRPLIENKIDRTVVNVEAAPTNAGATALEVLEKSPGISVDNDGNISLKGKQGVIVMMDGKPTYLSATDLANVLRNMPASGLDQIEIMTNPPAKYDASGNSGIINIKTKKSRNEGFNGSFTTGGTMGFYKRANATLTPVRASESLNLNYRKGKINLFGNVNYNYNENKSDLTLERRLYEPNGAIDVTTRQNSVFNGRNNNYTVKVGLDFFKNKRTTWGIVLNGFTFAGRPHNNNTQTLIRPDGSIESVLESISTTKLNFSNFSGNLNYKHIFDSTGQEITVDLDYVGYKNSSTSLLLTDTYDAPGGPKTGHFELKGDIPGVIDIYSIKSDYTKPLKNNMRFDAGFKISYVQNDNEVVYSRWAGNDWVKDNARSNHFIYKENINAAYISINKQWKKFSAQTGLRMENTVSRGNQVALDSSFTRNYTSLFPTIYLNYQINKSHTLTVSYGRRINRPNYQDLNPFRWYLDSLTFRQGNPYLLPQYANNFEIRHSFKNGLTTVLNYTETNDVLSQILKQDERITFLTPDNVAKLQNIGIGVTAPVKVAKWWNSNVFVNVFNNHYEGIVYNSTTKVNDVVDLQFTSFMVNVSNMFTFKKGWSGEISGWYRGKGVDGLSVADPMYFMTLGAQKNNLLKGKGTLRFNLRDPFHWQKFSGHTKYANIDVDVRNRWNNRTFTVSFSYRFGKSTVAQARRRTTGTNEEESRAGQGQQ